MVSSKGYAVYHKNTQYCHTTMGCKFAYILVYFASSQDLKDTKMK